MKTESLVPNFSTVLGLLVLGLLYSYLNTRTSFNVFMKRL